MIADSNRSAYPAGRRKPRLAPRLRPSGREALEQKPTLWNRFAAVVGPNTTVFVFNAVLMIALLSAGRHLGATLGLTLQTWTTIAWVMLAGLALGSYITGRLLPRLPLLPLMAGLLLLTAFAVPAMIPLHRFATSWAMPGNLQDSTAILLHALLVLGLPALLLGGVNPLILQQALAGRRERHRAIGAVLTWGTLGALVGLYTHFAYLRFTLPDTTLFLFSYVLLMVLGGFYLLLAIAAYLGQLGKPGRRNAGIQQKVREGLETPGGGLQASYLLGLGFVLTLLLLCAVRVQYREFGHNAYVWPIVSAVLLGGVALGQYLGGWLAARSSSGKRVIFLLFLASLTTLLISPIVLYLQSLHQESIWLMERSLPNITLLWSAAAFLLPACALGALLPLLAGRCLSFRNSSGRIIGNVITFISLGAMFAALFGPLLISYMDGPLSATTVLAALLALMAMLLMPRNPLGYLWFTVLLLLVIAAGATHPTARAWGEYLWVRTPTPPNTLFQREGAQARVAVREYPTMPEFRELYVNKMLQSQVNITAPLNLMQHHEWLKAGLVAQQRPSNGAMRALFLGSGGYVLPHYLKARYPESHVEVIERDRAITQAAYRWLRLPEELELHIRHQDSRRRVIQLLQRRTAGEDIPPFDFIINHNIRDIAVPYNVTTVEFFRQVAELLAADGVYVMDLVDLRRSGALLGATIHTLQQVFPQVQVYHSGQEPDQRDTFVLVATRQPIDSNALLERVRAEYPFDGDALTAEEIDRHIHRVQGIVLHDGYAPVDNLLLPAAQTLRETPEMIYWKRGWEHFDLGDLEATVHAFEQAVARRATWPEAWMKLGEVYTALEAHDDAVEAYRNALAGHPFPLQGHRDLAAALENAGRLDEAEEARELARSLEPPSVERYSAQAFQAMEQGDFDRALEQLEKALELAPEDASLLYNAGMAALALEDLHRAVDFWEQAITAHPGHEDSLYNLALGYAYLQQPQDVLDTVAELDHRGFEVPEDMRLMVQDIEAILEADEAEAETEQAPEPEMAPEAEDAPSEEDTDASDDDAEVTEHEILEEDESTTEVTPED